MTPTQLYERAGDAPVRCGYDGWLRHSALKCHPEPLPLGSVIAGRIVAASATIAAATANSFGQSTAMGQVYSGACRYRCAPGYSPIEDGWRSELITSSIRCHCPACQPVSIAVSVSPSPREV